MAVLPISFFILLGIDLNDDDIGRLRHSQIFFSSFAFISDKHGAVRCPYAFSVSVPPSSGLRDIMENVRNLANRGMHEAALQEARDAHRRNATDPVPLYLMSLLLQELGNEKEAFSTLRSALFLDPEFILAHYSMGILALGTGKAGEAKRHLRNAEDLLSRIPQDHVLPEGEGITAGELLAAVRTLRGKTL